jgi:hypothetical protein
MNILGEKVATGGEDAAVRIFDLETRNVIRSNALKLFG